MWLAEEYASLGIRVSLASLHPGNSRFQTGGGHHHRVVVLGRASQSSRGVHRSPFQRIAQRITISVRLAGLVLSRFPDTVICFSPSVDKTLILAGTFLPIRVLLVQAIPNGGVYRLHRIYRTLISKQHARVVVSTQHMAIELRRLYRVPTLVIPNPVMIPPIQRVDRTNRPAIRVISFGRFTHQKGWDILIDAVDTLIRCADVPDFTVLVYGGEPRDSAYWAQLTEKVRSSGLEHCISFAPATTDVPRILARADLFVFPSRYEGFGNALVEAMSCGVGCVASDCTYGPSEILDHGRYGILVKPNDAAALAKGLKFAISSPDRLSGLATAAQRGANRYEPRPIMKHWIKAIGFDVD